MIRTCDAEDLGRPPRLGQPDVGARRERRRLAVGQVDDPDAVTLAGQAGQRPAAGDLDVVGMGADGDQVQLQFAGSAMCFLVPRRLGAAAESIIGVGIHSELPGVIRRRIRPDARRSAVDLSHRRHPCLVTASRKVGSTASKRTRSICSIPREIATFQTWTSPASFLRVW